MQYVLDFLRARDLQCTVFATGRYTVLEKSDPAHIEIGVHPNFNETPPSQYETKLREMLTLYPHAQGVSSHAMMSSTPLLELFKRCGLKYDRNLLLYKQSLLKPFFHYNGLLRVPVFWEDDIWFAVEPGAAFSPDLLAAAAHVCVFNFHPIHIYMNTASQKHYSSFKPHYHEPHKLRTLRHHGYGVYTFFIELIYCLRANKISTGLLNELVTS